MGHNNYMQYIIVYSNSITLCGPTEGHMIITLTFRTQQTLQRQIWMLCPPTMGRFQVQSWDWNRFFGGGKTNLGSPEVLDSSHI